MLPVAENSVDGGDVEGGTKASEWSDEGSGRGLLAITAPVIKDGGNDVGEDEDGRRKSETKLRKAFLCRPVFVS